MAFIRAASASRRRLFSSSVSFFRATAFLSASVFFWVDFLINASVKDFVIEGNGWSMSYAFISGNCAK
jgi:hypothetical protein